MRMQLRFIVYKLPEGAWRAVCLEYGLKVNGVSPKHAITELAYALVHHIAFNRPFAPAEPDDWMKFASAADMVFDFELKLEIDNNYLHMTAVTRTIE